MWQGRVESREVKKTRYNQKIQSCHQDFQIRKVSCEVRSKTEEKHGKFRTPEEACVISGKSRRLCAISGSSSQSRHSFRAWTRGIFGNGAFRGKSRSSPDFGKGVSRRAKSKFASKGHAFAHVLDRNRALRSAHSSLNRLTPSARACQRAKSKFASKGHALSSRTYLTETALGSFLAQPAHAVGSWLSTSGVGRRGVLGGGLPRAHLTAVGRARPPTGLGGGYEA